MINDSVRQKVWDYVSAKHPKLIDIAAEIAMENDRIEEASKANLLEDGDLDGDSPTARRPEERLLRECYDQNCPNGKCGVCGSARCPKPINYLANGDNTGPLETSHLFTEDIKGVLSKPPPGFVWQPPHKPRCFRGCNFDILNQLADAKAGTHLRRPQTCEQLRGFNTEGKKGLSILFSPWTDFCLWCWAQAPKPDETKRPILILGKDNDTFAAQFISPARDWGVDQVRDVAKVWGASDRSTRNLFGTLANCALKPPVGTVGSKPASLDEPDDLQQFIAANRILIYNVWPWFRCGVRSSGNHGIHSDFSKVPYLWHELASIIDYLKPRKIAALGGWSWRDTLPAPDAWLRSRLLSPFSGNIDVFRHPSAWVFWSKPWNNPSKWGASPRWGGKANNQAFADFCI